MAMQSTFSIVGFWLLSLVSSLAYGRAAETPVTPAKAKVYALVSAIGNQFNVVSEEPGSSQLQIGHIEHLKFKHDIRVTTDSLLDLMALQSLDKVVTTLEPDSKRVFLTLGVARPRHVAASRRDDSVLAGLLDQLRKLPERRTWDRILLAMPAYRSFDNEGLSSHGGLVKLQGFGVFTQPNKTIHEKFRQDAISPDQGTVKSDVYIAPFAYIEILVLDPSDLSVIDRQVRYNHQKLANPQAFTLDVNQIPIPYLAAQLVGVIDGSIRDAVMQSKVNAKQGVIDVGPIKPATRSDSGK